MDYVSVENSSNRLIFRKNGQKTGTFSAKNWEKTGKILIYLFKKTGAFKFCFSLIP